MFLDRIDDVIRFLTSQPVWLCFVLVVGGAELLAVLGHWFARTVLDRFHPERTANFAAPVVTAIASTQAFFLGFVIVNLWVEFNGVAGVVQSEANNIRAIHYDLSVYSQTGSRRADELLRTYVSEVVGNEWALQSKGSSSPRAATLLDTFERLVRGPALASMDPTLRADVIARASALADARAERVHATRESVQPVIWIALIGLSVLLLVGSYFLDVEHGGPSYAVMIVFATAIGFGFFITIQLDYPLSGPTSVRAEPLQRAFSPIDAG